MRAKILSFIAALGLIGATSAQVPLSPGPLGQLPLQEEDQNGAHATPTLYIWCVLPGGPNQTAYVSEVAPLHGTSRLLAWNYDNRFRDTVNARYNVRLGRMDRNCHTASAARDATVARAATLQGLIRRGYHIVTLGVF